MVKYLPTVLKAMRYRRSAGGEGRGGEKKKDSTIENQSDHNIEQDRCFTDTFLFIIDRKFIPCQAEQV